MDKKWTKKERTQKACAIKDGAVFNRVWFSIPPGMRRVADSLTLSVLVDSIHRAWEREHAMVLHDVRVQLAAEPARRKGAA
jgi:hypothetical protein